MCAVVRRRFSVGFDTRDYAGCLINKTKQKTFHIEECGNPPDDKTGVMALNLHE